MKRLFVFFAAVLFLLPACASFFGEAETPERKAFKVGGQYVYIAIPVANFAALPSANPGTLSAVCEFDNAAYRAITQARTSLAAGGDRLTTALASAASALADLSLEVLGDAGIPDTSEIAAKTVVWATVGLQSAAAMRGWRKGYLRPKLEAMAAEDRAPTEAELMRVDERAVGLHSAIQARCPA